MISKQFKVDLFSIFDIYKQQKKDHVINGMINLVISSNLDANKSH